jgi:hypothetical protein
MTENSVYGFSDTRPVTHYNLRKGIKVNPYYYGDDWINNKINRIKECSVNDIPVIRNANDEAKYMISMTEGALSQYLKEFFKPISSNSGGGKKKKGGNLSLFLPLAILLAKDTNKAIRAMSNLGEDYIYSWFDYMNKLTGCFKYIYDKAMYDIYPYLVKMYNEGHVKEVAPFIMNNGPIYFNYVIQKLSDVEKMITDEIEKSKIEELQGEYEEMKSLFKKGKDEDKLITNDIIQERLRYAGILKTEIDKQERTNEEIEAEETELTKVEELITELEQKRLANEEKTINAILAQEQKRTQHIELQKETREKLGMLLADQASRQLRQNPKNNTTGKRGLHSKDTSQDKINKTTIRTKKIRGDIIEDARKGEEQKTTTNGGKRNTKKHYNKKKKTKKHAKKLHRKTKRG